MTEKEKAKELFKKYFKEVDSIGDTKLEYYYYIQCAKQCALIAVDEILDFLYDEMVSHNTYQYWRDVKTEIELL